MKTGNTLLNDCNFIWNCIEENLLQDALIKILQMLTIINRPNKMMKLIKELSLKAEKEIPTKILF